MRTAIEKLAWPNWVLKVYDGQGIMREMHFTYSKWGAKIIQRRVEASKILKRREWEK